MAYVYVQKSKNCVESLNAYKFINIFCESQISSVIYSIYVQLTAFSQI